jgi:NTE family protein
VSLESYARAARRGFAGALRRALAGGRAGGGAGLASYLLFDGGFCRELIELGRRDAQVRMEEIKLFLQV